MLPLNHPIISSTSMRYMYYPFIYSYSSKRTESPAVSLATDEELAPSEIGSHVARPTTPPPKNEAFEDFKKQRGSEINKVFLDNKGNITLHHTCTSHLSMD